MGKQFGALTDKHIEFIGLQKIYFVATAASTGTVNLSPKGGDSLRVLDANTIAWQNLTGSGNESAAHILKDTRMTIMFCAFDGAPMILRTYGQARMLHQSDTEWGQYCDLFPKSQGTRQIFILDIDMVQSSCGMSVPYFDYQDDRHDLSRWTDNREKSDIEAYWRKKNQHSIDGFDTEIIKRAGMPVDADIEEN
ncbi:pyridoxamine 5'-phosphate oxidase family protein [Vibrio sp. 10N.261.55.A7]|uniref:pyridoxamine 5'-phosphate oxidase family protein n=1 Tax=Vibrio sp. 10N.261.55.A7 TaxID=1880851 RepID=UPI000C85B95F|nr:pyridoxamine 5'-phosphate oxidase family protein [Vibrio sp. 10N.261.55.A7]PMJ89922.1 pyridoxamine 5'-phosphate oxidase [Vibrio sp. 10N.261.55.A7]